MKNIVIKFIRLITHKCPNCGEHLLCANNNDFEYEFWYCPKCDGEIEKESSEIVYIKKNFNKLSIEGLNYNKGGKDNKGVEN